MKSKTKKIIIIVTAIVVFYAVSITGFIFASKWLNSIDDSTRCDMARGFMVADGTFEAEHGSIKSVEIDKLSKSAKRWCTEPLLLQLKQGLNFEFGFQARSSMMVCHPAIDIVM